MNEWKTLGQYYDKESLVIIEAILNKHEIVFKAASPESHLNAAFGQGHTQPFLIQVMANQLTKAKSLVESEYDSLAPNELSLEEYSIEELKEIVKNPNDWHSSFVNGAEKILEKKGAHISSEEHSINQQLKQQLIEQGEKPRKVLFYIMWLFAFLGGLVGIIAGYFYWTGKVKDSHGVKYYKYNKKYRTMGFYMYITGIIAAVLQALLFGILLPLI